MAKYKNKRPTIFKENNGERIEVDTILDSADLNGKTTKEYMILTLLDGDNKKVGADILIEAGTSLSGL